MAPRAAVRAVKTPILRRLHGFGGSDPASVTAAGEGGGGMDEDDEDDDAVAAAGGGGEVAAAEERNREAVVPRAFWFRI